jgi:hypothetical protein
MLPLHHGHHVSGDDRTRTGDLSPDKRVLCAAELRPRDKAEGGIGSPQREAETFPSGMTLRSARPSTVDPSDSAGGIRTHDLELMRLARTAAPLPRKSGWLESNQRSPVPETGGVASSPTTRRRSHLVRVSGPLEGAGRTGRSPSTARIPPRTSGGSRTRTSGLRARRLHPSTTEARESTALESNQAVPAYQTGAFPRSPAVVRSRREGSNLRPPPSHGGAHPLSYGESWSLEESNLDPVGASHVCWPLTPRPQVRATAGSRTRAAALATPRATADTTVARHGRKESNPRRRGWSPPRRHVTSA